MNNSEDQIMDDGVRKRSRSDHPDRISDLPDSLLLKILSSLEMKEVVKSGILSKRWKHLWTLVPKLSYHFRSFSEEQTTKEQFEQFISFIGRTLTQHESHIKEFSLIAYREGFFGDKEMSAVMDDWIKRVLEKNVEVLKIDFAGLLHYAPAFLFQSSSLTTLELENFYLREFLVPVKWNSLKSLHLSDMTLTDELLEKMLSGCPVLECLSLEMIEDLECVNFVSPSARKLRLDNVCFESLDDNTVFKIRAPWVQELQISGRFIAAKCQIKNVSSLVKAFLMFNAFEGSFNEEEEEEVFDHNHKWIHMVPSVLKALSHVVELSVGSEVLQVLSLSKYNGIPSPTVWCKFLTINSPLWNYDVLGISYLLENAPKLEKLVIHVFGYKGERHPLGETKVFDDAGVDLSLPTGNLVHLKNVKINYYRNMCADDPEKAGGYCNDRELVAYIMRSSVVLERLVLSSSRGGCSRCSNSKGNCSFQYVPRLSSEILSKFLPGNEDEEWDLKKRKFCYEFRFSNYAALRSEH